jgi:branched-chain amino acid transport system substrate-binding protein
MNRYRRLVVTLVLVAIGALACQPAGPQPAAATKEPLKFAAFFDVSGPTANIGTEFQPGYLEWIEMINAEGGINGRKIETVTQDHKYDVPTSQELYKKWVSEGYAGILTYGTPITEALTPSLGRDKVVAITPGFGLSVAAEGTKYPYNFIASASYSSQGNAILQYIKESHKGPGNAKVAYLFYDNPAGRDPVPTFEATAKQLGIELVASVPVPTTTLDMNPIMADVKAKAPDFVVAHLFGRTPALSMQAHKANGMTQPLIQFVWGFSQSDIKVAGEAAEGVYGVQFTALAEDRPKAFEMLQDYSKKSGKAVNPLLETSAYYARGVYVGALISQALKVAGDAKLDGPGFKRALETIKNDDVYGMSPQLTMSEGDHEGTRKVRMYQVQNGKITRVKDWFEGPDWFEARPKS